MNSQNSYKNELTSDIEGLFFWHQERTIMDVTEAICERMEEDNVTRVELAQRLNKSKGFITQLLSGSKNMTIRTISDVFVALGFEFHPQLKPLGKEDSTVVLSAIPVDYKSPDQDDYIGLWGSIADITINNVASSVEVEAK